MHFRQSRTKTSPKSTANDQKTSFPLPHMSATVQCTFGERLMQKSRQAERRKKYTSTSFSSWHNSENITDFRSRTSWPKQQQNETEKSTKKRVNWIGVLNTGSYSIYIDRLDNIWVFFFLVQAETAESCILHSRLWQLSAVSYSGGCNSWLLSPTVEAVTADSSLLQWRLQQLTAVSYSGGCDSWLISPTMEAVTADCCLLQWSCLLYTSPSPQTA